MFFNLLNKRTTSARAILFSSIQYLSSEFLEKLVAVWKNEGVENCCILTNIRLTDSINKLFLKLLVIPGFVFF